jgi:hypothetical protein
MRKVSKFYSNHDDDYDDMMIIKINEAVRIMLQLAEQTVSSSCLITKTLNSTHHAVQQVYWPNNSETFT